MPPLRPPSGCVFWQRATGQTLVTSPRDHRFCTIGMYTHNLEMTPAEQADFKDTLEFFAGLGYLGAEELAEIPTLKERPHYVVYAPLEVTPIPPDVVLLFVQPGQALILAESCQAADRGAVPVIGRPACALVPMVRNSGRAAASLGCCGARSYVDLLAPVSPSGRSRGRGSTSIPTTSSPSAARTPSSSGSTSCAVRISRQAAGPP